MNNVRGSRENGEDYKIDFDRIAELIEKYKNEKIQGKIKGYTEEQTKVVFITPFFKALGWNTENRQNRNDSVSYEENIAGKRSDYGFSINGITKFYLEAKSLKEEEIVFSTGYDKQAVNYAWLKSCSWAVLTNFETLAVYNADSGKPEWSFTLKTTEYLSEKGKDKLKLLSKSGFEEGLLDTWAFENGKKPMKRPVDKQLLQDMIHFRETLSKDIKKNNPSVSEDDIDETVQRILDRLVFIRNAEDRGYESKDLQSNYNQWSQKEKGHLIKRVRELYQHYRDVYNSGLFGKESKTIHISDQVDISNETLSEVIQGLYSPKGAVYSYNFSVLDTDVLGKIYEQYLGNLLKQTPKRAKLEESKTHRKEQGIYYTPSYIVDYIVKNTVGEYIKTHTPEEIKKVRILDPACGSGSFLIRAYKELENYWFNYYSKNKKISKSVRNIKQAKFDPDSENEEIEFYSTKTEILKNNIFGVDLDPKAVEIAQLNLLLQISERKQRLPLLQNNVKVGNSLIDDPSISDRAFKWEEEFPEIMKDGGFDIVIGNPPYVNVYLMDEGERKYFNEISAYESPHLKYDLYTLFIEKGLKQMREKGYLGFIVPYPLLNQPYAELLRKYILDNCSIISIVDLSGYYVFTESTVKTIILVLRKESSENIRHKNIVRVVEQNHYSGRIDSKQLYHVEQSYFQSTHQHQFRLRIDNRTLSISDKMKNQSILLSDICYVSKGIVAYSKIDNRTKNSFLHDQVINAKCVPYLEGKDVERYSIKFKKLFLEYDPLTMSRPTFPELHKKRKILVRAMSDSLLSTFDDKGFFADQKLIICSKRTVIEKYVKPSKRPKQPLATNAEKYDEKYIVGLLNSSLMWYYYKSLMFGGLSILPEDIRNLPIRKIDFSLTEETGAHDRIVDLVDRILQDNERINEIGNNKTDESSKMFEETKKFFFEINELVYKIYGITEEEKKVIEESIR